MIAAANNLQRCFGVTFMLVFVLAIHSGGVIAGTYMNDGAVRCGHLLCKSISGVFTDNPLQEGYSLVATIPRGASNISVTELQHSANRIALRVADEPFFVNGDESDETTSGVYDAADAAFDYHRIVKNEPNNWNTNQVTEWITSTGPISESVDVMVLAFDTNPGIKYEYLMPIVPTNEHIPPSSDEYSYESSEDITQASANRQTLKSSLIQTTSTTTTTTTTTTPSTISAPPKRKRRFHWKIIDYTECSKSCGGGFQTPIIKCVRESPLRVFLPRKCAHLDKPDANEHTIRCNTQPCPGYWKIGEWSKCQCGKRFNKKSVQTREVKCVQELGTGKVIQVPHAACTDEHPKYSQDCECRISLPSTMVADQAPSKSTIGPIEKPDRGVWLTSEWSGVCTMSCGANVIEHRTIFCDRPTKLTERCDLTLTPISARQCESVVPCDAEWLVGTWGKCTGDCFNLTQSRTVQCVRNGRFVDDESCRGTERPVSFKRCEMNEVSYCADRWHYSQWSECSEKCGGGTQRRTIKCVKSVGLEMRESDNCRFALRQPAYQQCNVHSCSTMTNDIPGCIDNLSTCVDIAKHNLCNYEYFKQNCCKSCGE